MLIQIGVIAGAFGVKGEVKVKSFATTPSDIFNYGALLDQSGAPIFSPQEHRPVKDGFAVIAPEVKTREQAEALKNTKLYITRESLPEPEEDEFYYSDLEGLSVKTVDGKNAGTVVAIHEFGAGDMLEIKPPKKDGKQAQSFFHPFTKLASPKVDIKSGRIIIDLKAVEAEPEHERNAPDRPQDD
ncbi:ribosome maturation factor RimM [Fretibacter rubidus]|uniref:ribosome maturation factor RimM n=1 Tax=Fretibacter rubidus TaxID=570162 RepID=UPI00352B8317